MVSRKRSASQDIALPPKRRKQSALTMYPSLPPAEPQGLVARWTGLFLDTVKSVGGGIFQAVLGQQKDEPQFTFVAPLHLPTPAQRRRPDGTRRIEPATPSAASDPFLAGYSRPSIQLEHHRRSARRLSESSGMRKGSQRRQHVHANLHRDNVRANLAKELYSVERARGYGGDLETFQGFLHYRQHLQNIEARDIFSPSPSFSISSANFEISESKPTELLSTQHIQLALEKARESLRAPRPSLPFSPWYEQLHQADKKKDAEIESRIRPKKRSLPSSLPPDANAEVEALFAKRGVLSKIAREQVNDKDLSRLRPGQWLNDELINFYGALIMDRAEKEEAGKENMKGSINGVSGARPLRVHYFNTFFWPKVKEGYEKSRLSKWTKKIDIFKKDIVLIPINHSNSHWTAAAINFRRKRIEQYDSMGMERPTIYTLLRTYLDKEHQDKKKRPFDFEGWVDYTNEDTPLQENCYDCGVFTTQFLEALSRGEEQFSFSQKDMAYLRRRLVWEIGRAALGEPL